jgi:hypothetical protein
MIKEEVKKTGKSKNYGGFYLAVFNFIKEGKSPSFISKTLGISKQKVYYYTKILKEGGFIDKHKNGNWFVKVKNFSIGVKEKTDLHALNIRFPVLSGKLKDKDWEVRNKLNNWIPKYKEFEEFGGLLVRNNNNKSISVFLKPRKIDLLEDQEIVRKLANQVKIVICEYFRTEHDVILDSFNAEIKNLHLETYDKNLNLNKGEMITIDLGRKAEKIFPKDKMDAKAWGDNSPDPNMHGTNDLLHKKNMLLMPDKVSDIENMMKTLVPIVSYIAQNYASHIGVVEKLDKLLEIPKVKKYIKTQVKNSKQTKISDWEIK